jgi:3-oxoacyl-[acyl-carrier protein] reductase
MRDQEARWKPDGVLAKELRGRSISSTPSRPADRDRSLPERQAAELVERPGEMSPLERLGTPEDIAAAVAFLVGPDGGWINGQTLRANGGVV